MQKCPCQTKLCHNLSNVSREAKTNWQAAAVTWIALRLQKVIPFCVLHECRCTHVWMYVCMIYKKAMRMVDNYIWGGDSLNVLCLLPTITRSFSCVHETLVCACVYLGCICVQNVRYWCALGNEDDSTTTKNKVWCMKCCCNSQGKTLIASG